MAATARLHVLGNLGPGQAALLPQQDDSPLGRKAQTFRMYHLSDNRRPGGVGALAPGQGACVRSRRAGPRALSHNAYGLALLIDRLVAADPNPKLGYGTV